MVDEPYRIPSIPMMVWVVAWLDFSGVVVVHEDKEIECGLYSD